MATKDKSTESVYRVTEVIGTSAQSWDRTLSAAAVIGSRFAPDPLGALLGMEPALDELVKADLIDQVGFAPRVDTHSGIL